jgi:ketosteroid isomerase-like protein
MTMSNSRASIALLAILSCSPAQRSSESGADAGIDSANARLVQAYRTRDPLLYGQLFTDTAVFEWPAFTTVRGRAGLEAMARSNWASLGEMDLILTVASRRMAPSHATEFGAFEQTFYDAKGTRMIEFGRYVTVFARQSDGGWRIDHFMGFSDSTRPAAAR